MPILPRSNDNQPHLDLCIFVAIFSTAIAVHPSASDANKEATNLQVLQVSLLCIAYCVKNIFFKSVKNIHNRPVL
jgi:hypothetical protein